ncbi:polysaccharide deacetylase family protein [Alcanivorax sp. DP30]|uniref:polysaccharide deacetylase family protein n=1 Tax=Alcanivorax sp. DP30 TaxID=2606217 RepID=UPI001F351356|nr:polysaccharide deacetylase family protein [Alcanivorax sp. DP30]
MPESRGMAQGMTGLKALLSIHDVMPETRPQVSAMLASLSLPAQAVTLLVVPGRHWSRDDLVWLRGLQQVGHPLAGHGWIHQCQPPVTLYHKLHSALLSRQVAEHLSFSADGVIQLMNDCHGWFAEQGLSVSPLYVPPAWALGSLRPEHYHQLPFRYLETLAGVLDTQSGTLTRLPLVGFEADTVFRAWFLKLFNGYNVARAKAQQMPVRIGLHPFDLSSHLASQIPNLIARVTEFHDYAALGDPEWLPRQLL